MPFELPEETRLLREMVREFVRRELIPLETSFPEGKLPSEVARNVQAKAVELGLWLLDAPHEYGGADLDLLSQCTVLEEAAQTPVAGSTGVEIFGPIVGPILLSCDPAQREHHLIPVLQGDKRACFARSESKAEPHPSKSGVNAVRHGTGWSLNGNVWFIEGGSDARLLLQIVALTEPTRHDRASATCFLVDLDTPGVTVTREMEAISGERVTEVKLENVRLAEGDVVGGDGNGYPLMEAWLVRAWLRQAAIAVGVAQRSLAMAASYAKQRVTFGKPLSSREVIQLMLVDSQVEIEAARLMMYRCASRLDRGDDVRYEAAMVKAFTTEMATRVLDRAIQIHGGTGLTLDLPLARWYTMLRARRISEGSTEALKTYAAQDVLSSYY